MGTPTETSEVFRRSLLGETALILGAFDQVASKTSEV